MPSPAHLLVVATNHAESAGGVQAHLAHLLPRLPQLGFAVTVAYLGQRETPFWADGVLSVPLRRRLDLKQVIGLPEPAQWSAFSRAVRRGSLSQGPITHVATHTRFFPMSALGVRLGRRAGVPVVHTEHGAGSVVTGSGLVEAGSRGVDRSMGRWVLRHADRVVSVSAQTRDFVRALAGVDSVLVPNGIEVDAWVGHGPAPAEPRGIVFVGRLVAEKGWRDFLDAAHLARVRTGRDHPVHVVGDGDDAALAQAYARSLALPVTWHGRLEAARIAPLLHGAVYVNPSVAAEGFQLTQLEAFVAGAAVITYDVGVAADLAATGVGDVAVVARGDAAALGEATAQACARPAVPVTRSQVAHYDWDQVARDYAAVLRESGPRTR